MTKAHLTERNRSWLRTLSPEIKFEADALRFLLVHGSPRRINEYLYEDKPDVTFARIVAAAEADVIVCGHTHRPYDKTVGETHSSTPVPPGSRRTATHGHAGRSWRRVTRVWRSPSAGWHTTSDAPRRPSSRATCLMSSPPSYSRPEATAALRA